MLLLMHSGPEQEEGLMKDQSLDQKNLFFQKTQILWFVQTSGNGQVSSPRDPDALMVVDLLVQFVKPSSCSGPLCCAQLIFKFQDKIVLF